MQIQHAKRRFNAEPVICVICKHQVPNYRVLVDYKFRLLCYECCTNDISILKSIKASYRDCYYDIMKKMPIPDYRIAKLCIDSLESIKAKAENIVEEIRKKIQTFLNDLLDFLDETRIICEGYMQKLKKTEEQQMKGWHKTPPKFIQQEKYVLNIRQKHKIAKGIEQSLNNLKLSIPQIDDIKKRVVGTSKKEFCKSNITSAINIKGSIFLGTSEGQIVYESGLQIMKFPAHSSLIRSIAYDGQFRLFTGSDDSTIKAWDLHDQTPQLMGTFGHIEGIKSYHRQIVVLDGGQILASTRGQFDEYRIRLWNLNTFQNVRTLYGHQNFIRGMILGKNDTLVSVSEDRYLKIWQTKSLECIQEYFHGKRINFVFLNTQLQLICIIDEENMMTMLDSCTLELVNGVYIGRKPHLANAASFIYVNVGAYLHVYNWNCVKMEYIQVVSNATNILEIGPKIAITDGFGYIHEYYLKSLKN